MAAEQGNFKRGTFLSRVSNAEGLLVVFSGMRGNRFAPDGEMARWLAQTLPRCDVFHLSMGERAFLSRQAPESIAMDFVADLDAVCAGKAYREVRFLAHSAGASMARKTLIGGIGPISDDAPFEAEFTLENRARTWPRQVTRFVSVAGYARGWITNPRHSLYNRLLMNGYGLLGHFTNLISGSRMTEPLMFSLRRGSCFIFNTRMQWLSLMNSKLKTQFEMPQVIHVMPANDSLVSSVEVIDIEISDQHRSVHYIGVPQSDHDDVLSLGAKQVETGAAELRRKALLNAICGPLYGEARASPFTHVQALSPASPGVSTPLEYLDDAIASRPDPSVTDFFFVIHGIRDTGSWAKKIGAELRRQAAVAPSYRQVRTDTQSYGYFTSFPFLFPWIRKQKVEWMMDRYATAKALYPKARFSYIGHSNGTYLAASALRDYACCSFDKVVFAGSVVRHDYNWENLMKTKPARVGGVLNYVATNDIILAGLSDGFRKLLRSLDLGGAGHKGFMDKNVINIQWVVEAMVLALPNTHGSRQHVTH